LNPSQVTPFGVFTVDQPTKRLLDAANEILSNIIDLGEAGPKIDDYPDFPRDEEGSVWYPDVWELKGAIEAVEESLHLSEVADNYRNQ
jgi:hypothetical protein